MILRTQGPHSESAFGEDSSQLKIGSGSMLPASPLQPALDLANELAARYEIASLSGLLATTAAAIARNEIRVAVFGRFKAGKSSFLNDIMGREILPVGVV